MARTFSADWTAELQKSTPEVYECLELNLRDAAGTQTPVRIGTVGGIEYSDPAGIQTQARLLEVGQPEFGFDVLAPSIRQVENTATVADPDGSLLQLIEAGENEGVYAAITWRSPNTAGPMSKFQGVLGTWSPRAGQIAIKLRPETNRLDTEIPVVPILRSDWPELTGATAQYYNWYNPIVLGAHNSGGLKGTGMVRCLPVAWTSGSVGWYAVAAHICKTVTGVCVGTSLKTLTTHYTVETTRRGGKAVHLIKFTAGNIPLEGDVVTCNVEGADRQGDGTGPLETNPVRQIRKILVDYAAQVYLAGTYWSSMASVLLDEPKWSDAIAIADALKLEGAAHIGGSTKQTAIRDLVESWVETWRMFRIWWNEEGKLAISFVPLKHPGYRDATGGKVIRRASELQDPGPDPDDSACGNRVACEHLWDASADGYLGQLQVYDDSALTVATRSISMPWSVARIQ